MGSKITIVVVSGINCKAAEAGYGAESVPVSPILVLGIPGS